MPDDGKRWVWIAPKDWKACTCQHLAWILNAQRGVNCFDGFPYCLEPHRYLGVTPVSRIMRRGCVAPPSMRLHTLLENLWGDQPGTWAFAVTPTDYDASEQSIHEEILREGSCSAGGVCLRLWASRLAKAGQGWLD